MARPRTIGYRRARSVTLLAGLIVIGLVMITMLARQVDPIEVIATVSFAPIFVGMLFWGWRAGMGLGLAAAGLYVSLRLPAIRLVGVSPLLGLLASRVVGFVAFGGIGGWAASELGAAIGKLELYDSVDDATGLGNARSVVMTLDRELARAARHSTVFSVVTADVPQPVHSRRRMRFLKELGRTLAGSMRTSDHIGHLTGPDGSTIVVVLPETGPEGARTVAAGLVERLTRTLDLPVVPTLVLTVPGDEEPVRRILTAAQAEDVSARPRP